MPQPPKPSKPGASAAHAWSKPTTHIDHMERYTKLLLYLEQAEDEIGRLKQITQRIYPKDNFLREKPHRRIFDRVMQMERWLHFAMTQTNIVPDGVELQLSVACVRVWERLQDVRQALSFPVNDLLHPVFPDASDPTDTRRP